jgi:hypothetical protein
VKKVAYSHKNSKGDTFWLHSKGKLFFFSRKPEESIDLPSHLEVFENQRTMLPMVRKKKV